MPDRKKIVIIGNGVSGITAARHIRKLSNHEIIVISNESEYFFSRTALMYVYMGHMKFEHIKPYEDWFWEKNRIELVHAHVEKVNIDSKNLQLQDKSIIPYDKLIIASGSHFNKFGWPGQDLIGVQGLYHVQDLQTMEENTGDIKRAVIVGGGLIGIELCEMLHSRNIPTTFLVREKSFWDIVLPKEESEMIGRHMFEHKVDLRLSTELEEIIGDDNGKVKSIKTKSGEIIECGFVGLSVGVSPNTDFLKDSGIEIEKGILVNEFLETSVKDIYAIGDCAEFRVPLSGRRPIEQVWYTGKIMGETLAHTLCLEPTEYRPGNWFNSAKFFDIEYQTYGNVPASLPDDLDSLYWEHENGKRSIRIVFEKNSKCVVGFNFFGIRFRHKICDKWISENATLNEVIQQLPNASFDPEFHTRFEKEAQKKFLQLV